MVKTLPPHRDRHRQHWTQILDYSGVDGKQPLYSEGATMAELAAIAIELGATTALNLDGGGSVTLAIGDHNRPRTLNSPIQSKIPTWERPIANHLGFFA